MNLFDRIEKPITHWLHLGLNFVQAHPHLGFLFAFIISLAESLPIIGTIVPGSLTMTAVGTLIGTGALPFYTTIGWSIAGAFAGDYLGYFIGFRYHDKLRSHWPFKKHPQILDKGEEFFNRHGGKSIVIGRFFGPLRSAVPMIAGCLQFTKFRFIIAALPSAILWALMYTIPGILIGALSMDLPKGQVAKFIIGGLAIVVMLWALLWIIKTISMRVYRAYRKYMHIAWQKLHASQDLQFLTDKHHSDDDWALRKTFVMLLFLILFAILWLNVAYKGPLTDINNELMALLANARSPFMFHLMAHITLLGNKLNIFGFLIIYSALLLRDRNLSAVKFLWLNTITTTAITYGMKFVFYNQRPTIIAQIANSNSFPSGHVAISLAAYCGVAYILAASYKKYQQNIIFLLAGILVTIIAISRLYLGMHWITDVVGSALLGIAILNFYKVFYHPKPNSLKRHSLLWLLFAFVVPYIFVSTVSYKSTLKQTALNAHTIVTTTDSWWQQDGTILPIVRLNRLGHPSQALNIQWLGSIAAIKSNLLTNNWEDLAQQNHLQKTLNRLSSYKAQDHMPLLIPKYDYQVPMLTMIHKGLSNNDGDMEIRLWRTSVKFTDNKQQLWIGNISRHFPPNKLISIKKSDRSYYTTEDSIKFLLANINNKNVTTKQIQTKLPNDLGNKLSWDGELILLKQ
jgi:membrane protein DedA with SNARE-associated domain/membrane-associated phospholipid phosphatase